MIENLTPTDFEQPRYFSSSSETSITYANLPHWHQRCTVFLTFRLADSLPQDKLAQLEAEQELWLKAHPRPWTPETEQEYRESFPERIQSWLDANYGSCVLKSSAIRELVEGTLRHFDGIRYTLYAFVVMPNHVHVLFLPRAGFDSSGIIHSWKSYTSTIINRQLGKTGPLWQKESYDHLVRNVKSFNQIRSYIRANSPALAYDRYHEMESVT